MKRSPSLRVIDGGTAAPSPSGLARPDGPLVVSYGAGVDSTAMLVEMVRRGVRPDLILSAATGGELPETYAYVGYFSEWLQSKGFPAITIVRRAQGRTSYTTLEGNCLANETLPSLAFFGRKGCSQKWKREPMDREVDRVFGKMARPEGRSKTGRRTKAKPGRTFKIVRAIGYDAGPKDMRRKAIPDDASNVYWYPLRELGWDRERCEAEIRREGLKLPIKSACFFCPARKPEELRRIMLELPHLADRILAMEAAAAPHLDKVEGLWMRTTKARPGRMTDFILAVRAEQTKAAA